VQPRPFVQGGRGRGGGCSAVRNPFPPTSTAVIRSIPTPQCRRCVCGRRQQIRGMQKHSAALVVCTTPLVVRAKQQGKEEKERHSTLVSSQAPSTQGAGGKWGPSVHYFLLCEGGASVEDIHRADIPAPASASSKQQAAAAGSREAPRRGTQRRACAAFRIPVCGMRHAARMPSWRDLFGAAAAYCS
jgi:hypothetical protein